VVLSLPTLPLGEQEATKHCYILNPPNQPRKIENSLLLIIWMVCFLNSAVKKKNQKNTVSLTTTLMCFEVENLDHADREALLLFIRLAKQEYGLDTE
jgi:hypothetical protein